MPKKQSNGPKKPPQPHLRQAKLVELKGGFIFTGLIYNHPNYAEGSTFRTGFIEKPKRLLKRLEVTDDTKTTFIVTM